MGWPDYYRWVIGRWLTPAGHWPAITATIIHISIILIRLINICYATPQIHWPHRRLLRLATIRFDIDITATSAFTLYQLRHWCHSYNNIINNIYCVIIDAILLHWLAPHYYQYIINIATVIDTHYDAFRYTCHIVHTIAGFSLILAIIFIIAITILLIHWLRHYYGHWPLRHYADTIRHYADITAIDYCQATAIDNIIDIAAGQLSADCRHCVAIRLRCHSWLIRYAIAAYYYAAIAAAITPLLASQVIGRLQAEYFRHWHLLAIGYADARPLRQLYYTCQLPLAIDVDWPPAADAAGQPATLADATATADTGHCQL